MLGPDERQQLCDRVKRTVEMDCADDRRSFASCNLCHGRGVLDVAVMKCQAAIQRHGHVEASETVAPNS